MTKRQSKEREDFSNVEVPEGARLIPLTQGFYALVDEEDFERVSQYNWCAHKAHNRHGGKYYAVTNINKKTIRLHRFVTNTTESQEFVDHKSLDTMDNRKNNLRVVTNGQNQMNTPSKVGSASQYKGVFKSSVKDKWVSKIVCDGKTIHLGTFTSEVEAAEAYDLAAAFHHGEFARLNFYNTPF